MSPASSIQPTGKPYHVYCRLLGFSCRPTSGKRSCQSSFGWETKTIEFIFPGIKMFWARLRLVLARAVWRGLKWILRRAENIFIPKNINRITIIFGLGVRWENKTWKTKCQQTSLKNIFLTNAVRKRQQTQKWRLDFDRLLRRRVQNALFESTVCMCLQKQESRRWRKTMKCLVSEEPNRQLVDRFTVCGSDTSY